MDAGKLGSQVMGKDQKLFHISDILTLVTGRMEAYGDAGWPSLGSVSGQYIYSALKP
jgi:hypothetical protein